MIKIKGRIGKSSLVILGLSHANLDRLRAEGLKGAIKVEGKPLGLDADIWITAADTEATMVDAFREGINADTIVHIDDRLKS